MNISVIIQGEGKGHFSQAMEAIALAHAQGVKVTGCYMGRSLFRKMPGYFRKTAPLPLKTFLSPNFMRTPDQMGIRMFLSLAVNMVLVPVYLFEAVRLGRMLRRDGAGQLLNFYDPVGSLAGKWFRRRAHKVCISHHFYLSHPDFIHPHGLERSYFWLQLMNHILIRQADEVLALSFRKGSPRGKIRVVPPLVAGDLRKAASIHLTRTGTGRGIPPGDNSAIREMNQRTEASHSPVDKLQGRERKDVVDRNPDLCYFLNPGFVQEMLKYYADRPGQQADIFTEDPGPYQAPGNVRLRTTGREEFLAAMQHAGRVICTAGFDTVAEAFYLGTPVFLIPSENHYEQYCNALDAARTGMAFQLESLDDLGKVDFTPAGNTRFVEWVKTGYDGFFHEHGN